MRHMRHTRTQGLARTVALGAMLVVATSATALADPDKDAYLPAEVSLTSVLDSGTEWTLADIYAGYADDDRAATEGPDADATGAGVEDPGEWTLADIYAGYADAESDSVATVDGDR